jgi:DNA modification methylase
MTADKGRVTLLHGDCRELLKSLPDQSIDSIVTDPPYELGFMGRSWDASGIAYDIKVWQECLRVLKPGGHLLAFGGTRTYHRMTCAIEDAGFEVRDCIMWVYGSGFPKSHDVSKAIDKAAGAEREVIGVREEFAARANKVRKGISWADNTVVDGSFSNPEQIGIITAPATEAAKQWQGWGSALKPAVEPIVVARKPLIGTIVDNVLAHGTGAINIDGCRVEAGRDYLDLDVTQGVSTARTSWTPTAHPRTFVPASGRWPANIIHDGSQEVVELFPDAIGSKPHVYKNASGMGIHGTGKETFGKGDVFGGYNDSGSAARFFYCAKTSASERGDNRHPTVKPISLMRYLCRLVTPPSGTVLDPFAGSGSTMVAARQEGFGVVGCELEAAHIDIIKRRLQMPPEPEVEQEAQPNKKTDIKQQTKPQQLKLML